MKTKEQKITGKDLRKEIFRNNKFYLSLAVFCTILNAGINLFLQWLVQQLMDVLAGNVSMTALNRLLTDAFLMLGVLIISGLLKYVSKPAFISKGMRQYKDYVFEKIAEKNIAAFSKENSAVYISALSNDANIIETNYLEKICPLISHILTFAGAVAMMLYYSPILMLTAILLTLFPLITSIMTGNRLAGLEQQVSDKNSSFLAMLADCLRGFSVVKSFKAEKDIEKLVWESNKKTAEAKCRRDKINVLIEMLDGCAGITAQLGVFFVGAYMAVLRWNITPGIVIAFTLLMNFVIAPVSQIPAIWGNMKAAFRLTDKLAEVLSENICDEGEIIKPELNLGIKLKNVSFGYKEEEQILKAVSFHFEPQKAYAIVGASGSGKSTLLNLLMAGKKSYNGEIYYDERELKEINTASLYDLVSLVEQNVFVFNRSVIENITMFKNFEEEEVKRVIEQSGLSGLLETKGRDYLCGENGCGLSGGEKQRISIARGLLKKSPVFLVDEATSALDKQMAYHISESILKLSEYTRIVVTHSLEKEILEKYDKILVLKDGTIYEQGTFEELMKQKGYFYSLYRVTQ